MPTGYTVKIETGEITDVKGFALECAKAFLSKTREVGLDYKIPRKLEVEEYYIKNISNEENELKRLENLSEIEIQKEYEEIHNNRLNYYNNIIENNRRYQNLINDIKLFQINHPNFPDNLINFMLEQLDVSVSDISKFKEHYTNMPFIDVWHYNRIETTKSMLNYYKKTLIEHENNVNNTNKWLDAIWSAFE